MILDPILIVDDEPDLRVPLRNSLEEDGYTVDEAESAAEALAKMERRRYSVVVTDLYMPGGLSGLELIDAVKLRDPEVLCIVITGYASLDVSIRALKCGAYDFLQKPFKLVEIEAVLDRALEHARIQKQLQAHQENLEALVLERSREIQAFHREVLRLNELLIEAQGQLEESSMFRPFMGFLQSRFKLDAWAVYLLEEGTGWTRILAHGERPWFKEEDLPQAEHLQRLEAMEWNWEGGYSDGLLVPFRRSHRVMGALYLGFEHRSAFDPEDPAFLFWKLQVEAALHGLRCARAHAVFEVAKALGWE
jgi:FixJ family two-component response regulator